MAQNDEKTNPPKTNPPGKKAASEPVPPKVIIRSNRVMMHHLFSSDEKPCKKNVSYEPGEPELKDVKHIHFFHSIDMHGKKLTQSSMILNHYHDVDFFVDADGNLKAQSGPPKKMVTVHRKGGVTETVPQLISWLDERTGEKHMDDHRHEWTYEGTDEFTARGMQDQRIQNQAEMEASGVSVNHQIKPLQNARALTAEDGVTIAEM